MNLARLPSSSTPLGPVDLLGAPWERDSGPDLANIYLHARYYDPVLGIFLSPDPAGADLNTYRYAGGDPVNRLDPSGLEWRYLCTGTGTKVVTDSEGRGHVVDSGECNKWDWIWFEPDPRTQSNPRPDFCSRFPTSPRCSGVKPTSPPPPPPGCQPGDPLCDPNPCAQDPSICTGGTPRLEDEVPVGEPSLPFDRSPNPVPTDYLYSAAQWGTCVQDRVGLGALATMVGLAGTTRLAPSIGGEVGGALGRRAVSRGGLSLLQRVSVLVRYTAAGVEAGSAAAASTAVLGGAAAGYAIWSFGACAF